MQTIGEARESIQKRLPVSSKRLRLYAVGQIQSFSASHVENNNFVIGGWFPSVNLTFKSGYLRTLS